MQTFAAAYYSAKNRKKISQYAVADLDTAAHLWGGLDNSRAFRNVLVGEPERRGEIWQAWISANEIELSDENIFYVLRHTAKLKTGSFERWAVYCALDLHEPKLFIHEDVVNEGVERARQATEACETDMAPIFVGYEESLYRDVRQVLEKAVTNQTPLLVYEESATSKHTVWPLSDKDATQKLKKLLDDQPLFLLDGHHRLAAAKENHRHGLGDGKILACLCSMDVNDTLILPIHRTVHYSRWMLPDAMFADLTRSGCKVTELTETKVTALENYLTKEMPTGAYCLALHSYSALPRLVQLPSASQLPQALAPLAVARLDHLVLESHPQATAIPVASLELVLEQLALDQCQAAFFLPAVQASQVRAVALAKLKMPRKSTRFVPKPALGLICRPWMVS